MTPAEALRVMKFGGAALRDGPSILAAARVVASSPGPRVVVTSAMQGITDLLAEALERVRTSESEVFVLVEALRDRHQAALDAIDPRDEAAAYALRTTLERVERLLYGIAYTQETTPRLHDLVLTFGERLMAPLMAAALRSQGRQAVALDGEHAAIRSLGPFGNARPDMKAMRSEAAPRLQAHLVEGRTPVVTGFYGVDAEGHPTLFGRGGSDYVASLIAYGLQADAVELWKEDVAGFLTADPRAVDGTRLVPELSYAEAAELAHFGAKILHARAVEPVELAGIPIHIRCVRDPDAAGSVIRADVGPSPHRVRSVVGRDHLAILRLNGPGMAHTPGVGKRVFDALSAAGINVINMATSQASFALLLDEADAAAASTALEGLVGGVVQSIDTHPGRSLVCVVGKGLGETPGSAAMILDAVASKKVNVEMISIGASDIAINFIIRTPDRHRAMQGIHEAFHRTRVEVDP